MNKLFTPEHYNKTIARAMVLYPLLTIEGAVERFQIGFKQEERAALLNPTHIELLGKSVIYFRRLEPYFRVPRRACAIADDIKKEMGVDVKGRHGIILIAAKYVGLGTTMNDESLLNVIYYDREAVSKKEDVKL